MPRTKKVRDEPISITLLESELRIQRKKLQPDWLLSKNTWEAKARAKDVPTVKRYINELEEALAKLTA